MPENIYTKYNVDVNKLTRDYQKFPLKKIPRKSNGGLQYEELPKKDFVYLYIECNLSRNILAQYLNVSNGHIDNLVKIYKVKKSPKQWIKNSKKTNLEIYGVENPFQSEICKEKIKQTNLKNLGIEYPGQSPIVQEKYKETCLKLFGVENPLQSPIIREKAKHTNLERYGVEWYTQSDEYKNLYKDEEFVNNRQQKQYETKKKNNSFGKSEKEEEIYNLLLTKFKEVKRQYRSDLYPFPCDFYIPEKDLYIEYQGYFQHGKEPYIGTDEQNELINEWKENGSEQYLRAIDTWTVRDPLKRSIAKQNNLNWIEFFNMKEFTQWFETI